MGGRPYAGCLVRNTDRTSVSTRSDLTYIRRWSAFFMAALLVSGLTAVPLELGTRWLSRSLEGCGDPWYGWAAYAAEAVAHVGAGYPRLFHGTDRPAFAQLVIALAIIGPYRDPVRNKWLVGWGPWCCLLVLPLAFLWAPVSDIPILWRCVDASFGLFGAIPLWSVRRRIEHRECRYEPILRS